MDTHNALAYLKIHEIDLIMAAIIAIIGIAVSLYTKKYLLKIIANEAGDQTKKYFFVNLCYLFILAIIAIMVLNKLGVPTTSLLAVLGASSLAIALSLKDSLSNIAAGVILIFQKPFKIGDNVTIDNITGTVKFINIYNTIITSASNDIISFPNNKIVNEKITNHTNHPTRKLIIPIYLPFDQNIEKIKEHLMPLFTENDMVLPKPAATIVISNLDTTGMLININLWTKTGSYADLKISALETIQSEFKKQKVKFVTTSTPLQTS